MYWNLVDAYGFESNFYDAESGAGNTLALQLVMDGLKLQPCSPTFLDARDAILLADQNDNGGANQCLIWEAFAKRGMGVGADDGKGHNDVNVKADFTVPAQCN
jgi:extracellular elastinolytic metalloproteinase